MRRASKGTGQGGFEDTTLQTSQRMTRPTAPCPLQRRTRAPRDAMGQVWFTLEIATQPMEDPMSGTRSSGGPPVIVSA